MMHTDRIPEETRTAVIRRLRRAAGQLQAVARLLEDGADCVGVAGQLTAAKNAVGNAGIKLLAAGLAECIADAQTDDLRPDEFEKLLVQLA